MRSSKRIIEETHRMHQIQTTIAIENYINQLLTHDPKYQHPKKLNRFERQVFSQNGEDGIITEIFKRIQTTNKFFVEFGVSKDGLENNTINLLLNGWQGCWMEAKPKASDQIQKRYRTLIQNRKLTIKTAMINAENIQPLFQELSVPSEFDFLSIDIDSNDYWVWKAIKNYSPRVLAIEYNATLGPDLKWVMKYNPQHTWDGSSYFGASLKSMELLGQEKGYKLVGCNLTGSNAFFVREDCTKDLFLEPLTSENHYEPPRYHLTHKKGHPRSWGDFENI
jgi:hypothetical protein